MLARNLVVGGRMTLELHGNEHYLKQKPSTTFLCGPDPPPTWLQNLERAPFTYRNDGKLFDKTFHQVDKIMEGLTTLSPARVQGLLTDCHNVTVKRLFFFFADRHDHAWLKRIDRKEIGLGSGKRMRFNSWRYDPKYMITVPANLGDEGGSRKARA